MTRVPTRTTSMPSSVRVAAGTPASRRTAGVTSCPRAARRPKISCRWISAPPACGFSRSCQFTSEDAQLDPPEPAGERVEHAVHEPRAFRGAEALGETDGLLDAPRAAGSRRTGARRRRGGARSARSTPSRSSRQLVVTSASAPSSAAARVARARGRAARRRRVRPAPTARSSQTRASSRAQRPARRRHVPRVQRLQRPRPRAASQALLSSRQRHRAGRRGRPSRAPRARRPTPCCRASPPARASACAIVVAGEDAERRPACRTRRVACARPRAASPATKSKCGVSPRITAPDAPRRASYRSAAEQPPTPPPAAPRRRGPRHVDVVERARHAARARPARRRRAVA